jgi:hypothetical protein
MTRSYFCPGSPAASTHAKREAILVFCLCLFIGLACAAQKPGSMNIGTLSYNHWPTPSPSILRIRAVVWPTIETSRGTYSPTFGGLDNWIAAAQARNAQLMYTFYRVPAWASSNNTQPPSDLFAVNESCQAPLAGVLRPTGDCMWAEYITRFMQHVCGVSANATQSNSPAPEGQNQP